MMWRRCPICEWPMSKDAASGCVPGNCSYRPEPGSEEHRRIERNKVEADRLYPNEYRGVKDENR